MSIIELWLFNRHFLSIVYFVPRSLYNCNRQKMLIEMSKHEKIIYKILAGKSDFNIRFHDLISILKFLGFSERIKGDHHILFRDGIEEILNLQPKGSLSKAYQVKQVRNIIVKYKLG